MRLRSLLPDALSRPIRRLALGLVGLAAAGAFVAPAGCGGATRGAPVIGGESHFLHWCSDTGSGSCDEPGLECISGLCAHPCVVAEPNACSAFTSASCTSESIEPGAVAVCDVSCSRDADCALLGADYGCEGSFCRAPELADGGSSGGRACAECFESPTLRWTWDGGRVATVLSSDLTRCNSYHHELVVVGADDQLGSPQCSAPVDRCPSRNLAVLNTTLQDPELRAGLTAHTVFGRDARPVDGVVRKISVGDDSFFVGDPCIGAGANCIEIPAAVSSLVSQLQALDALQLVKPPCAEAFPR